MAPSPTTFIRRLKALFRLDRDPDTPQLNWTLLRQFWELTIPYWRRRGAWTSWLILALYTGYTFAISLFNAVIAKYTGDRLNALAVRNGPGFYKIIIFMIGAQFVYSIVSLVFNTPYQLMEVRWQQWMTQRFLKDYLHAFSYYFLNRDRAIDNPDERIAVDAANFVYYPLSLVTGLVRCISNLFVFGYILRSFGWYLVPLSALSYIVYSLSMLAFNRPIMTLNYIALRLQGDFRFSLVNVRTSAEPVAFLRGEPAEQRELHRRYDLVIDNQVKNIWWSLLIGVYNTFTSEVMLLIPNVLIGRLVLKGAINLSGYTQALNAWSMLGSSFGFFGQEARNFASYGAVIGRLYALREHCIGSRREEIRYAREIIRYIESDELAVNRLNVLTPKGDRVLVEDLSFQVAKAGRVMITGVNGVGKTSLLRSLAGLWIHGSGEVHLPNRDKILFLPQQPYMSLGTLREQMTYPDTDTRLQDDELRSILHAVQLERLEKHSGGLDVSLDWRHTLSPGEQQRLTFTRVLVHRPEMVILDEATSALDSDAELKLYDLLRQMNCSYLSVTHRVGLISYHDTILELLGEGRWRLSTVGANAYDQQIPAMSS